MHLSCDSQFFSELSYNDGLKAQARALEEVKLDSTRSKLLGLSHPPVITLGRRIKPGCDLTTIIYSTDGFEVIHTDRGGEVTLHNPGQLLIYPIFNLKTHKLKVKDFICKLLRATKNTLETYHIDSEISLTKPGVYTEKGKIAFIGLRVKQGIVTHGLSINVNNELIDFQKINPCGLGSIQFDKVSHYHRRVELSDFYQQWVKHFHEQF